jgi:hypothetical protein
MKRVKLAKDVSGRDLFKGDTVATLNGQVTGRVWELAEEDGETFVQIRPVYQPYGSAMWYASDQVIWVATPARRKRSRDAARKTSPISSPASTPTPTPAGRQTRVARKK